MPWLPVDEEEGANDEDGKITNVSLSPSRVSIVEGMSKRHQEYAYPKGENDLKGLSGLKDTDKATFHSRAGRKILESQRKSEGCKAVPVTGVIGRRTFVAVTILPREHFSSPNENVEKE